MVRAWCSALTFLAPYPPHMEIPRLGVESELQLVACATAIAMPDMSRICGPHHSSWQRWILNPLREARDQTHNLMVPGQICFHCTTMGIPPWPNFNVNSSDKNMTPHLNSEFYLKLNISFFNLWSTSELLLNKRVFFLDNAIKGYLWCLTEFHLF